MDLTKNELPAPTIYTTTAMTGLAIVYDGDGNRVSETAAGVTTKYLVDTLNPTGYSQVLDELVNGSVTKTYTYGLQRISENQLVGSTWTPSFYGYDGHGNVRFTTNTAGTVGNTYQLDAFGIVIASTGSIANTYLYSGERFDSNIGLYHLRARYYNRLTGRFVTMDPELGKIFSPGTLHKYVYAENNPVNRLDPPRQPQFEDLRALYQIRCDKLKAKRPGDAQSCASCKWHGGLVNTHTTRRPRVIKSGRRCRLMVGQFASSCLC